MLHFAFPLFTHVALVGKLSYNAGVYLAADYTPEFDSFKERLLELGTSILTRPFSGEELLEAVRKAL